MTFLKKLGQVVFKLFEAWTGFEPLVSRFIPSAGTGQNIVADVDRIFGVITTADKMFAAAYGPEQKTGADKLRAAVPFVAQILGESTLLAGKHPKDETAAEAALTKITSGLADFLNAYE